MNGSKRKKTFAANNISSTFDSNLSVQDADIAPTKEKNGLIYINCLFVR